jgi:hypothetical protein
MPWRLKIFFLAVRALQLTERVTSSQDRQVIVFNRASLYLPPTGEETSPEYPSQISRSSAVARSDPASTFDQSVVKSPEICNLTIFRYAKRVQANERFRIQAQEGARMQLLSELKSDKIPKTPSQQPDRRFPFS